ncbi:cache domain-containing protein [Marinobacter sp. X15-166B]|uniref:cache domain-containing protein n=1 Tax=Marinobacter sp. X15-166B TaxID=1897620 RepID=UPI001D1784C0|nr:cache domain-containing protein [Marinobacter sp. X15-166B]
MLRHWFDSLVNRAVALVIVAVVITAVAVATINSLVSRQALESQARAQIERVAGFIAEDLDAKLSQRLALLNDIARSFSLATPTLPARAQQLIDRQLALQHLFDGVYVFDARGVIVGERPLDVSVAGFSAAHRTYFQDTLRQPGPQISAPYAAYPDNRPVVMMTAPLLDDQQRPIGVLGGAILLDQDNFMGEISGLRLGQRGYVTIGTRTGMTLAHGLEADRVMQPVDAESAGLADALSGREVTRFRECAEGQPTLETIRQMQQAPWFVRVVWPVQEAFAPAHRLTGVLLWILLAVIAVLAPLAYWNFKRLMRPMGDLARQITDRHQGLSSRPVAVGGGREIRQVAEVFNTVMSERTEVLESLADREAFFPFPVAKCTHRHRAGGCVGPYRVCEPGVRTDVRLAL